MKTAVLIFLPLGLSLVSALRAVVALGGGWSR